ncbi:hypothetical protein KP509_37G005800 [Ceratopteris richardii]|uniref:Uncharacterized protein n=1 Tax=Ceratopteris richardii TaxID=49495 RepID=A0A8T2Q632_CERRI|nr:hypothetical protein KP509_37G005800 [Ceratopteris richardii]
MEMESILLPHGHASSLTPPPRNLFFVFLYGIRVHGYSKPPCCIHFRKFSDCESMRLLQIEDGAALGFTVEFHLFWMLPACRHRKALAAFPWLLAMTTVHAASVLAPISSV